jgi:hypothetical protein
MTVSFFDERRPEDDGMLNIAEGFKSDGALGVDEIFDEIK